MITKWEGKKIVIIIDTNIWIAYYSQANKPHRIKEKNAAINLIRKIDTGTHNYGALFVPLLVIQETITVLIKELFKTNNESIAPLIIRDFWKYTFTNKRVLKEHNFMLDPYELYELASEILKKEIKIGKKPQFVDCYIVAFCNHYYLETNEKVYVATFDKKSKFPNGDYIRVF